MSDYRKYVHAVYSEKSFSKAARKLFVAQPWLSSVIKKVERDIGFLIFDRTTQPLTLTEAGLYYIEQIEKIMAIEEEMRRHFGEMRKAEDTRLHIGSSMFFCTYVLPALLEDFREENPNVTLTFSEGSSSVLAEKIAGGRLDFLLEAEEPQTHNVKTVPWAAEEIILAVPAQFKINGQLSKYKYSFGEFLERAKKGGEKAPVPLSEFQNEDFIFLKEGNDIHWRALKICENAGFSPRVSLYLTQMMTAYYMVCESRGVSMLRSTIAEHVTPTDAVVFYRLDDPLAHRNIYLSYPNSKLSPVQRLFIEYLEKEKQPDALHNA